MTNGWANYLVRSELCPYIWAINEQQHMNTATTDMTTKLMSELLAAYMLAVLAGNDKAADHFAARIAEEDAKLPKQ